jgi:hypothetical protein
LDILPEPFLGRPDAPLVLLNLNPGYKPADRDRHRDPIFAARSRGNLIHSNAEYPFYLLDPELTTSGWWNRKLRPLIAAVTLRTVGRNVLCVEYFPYHSKRFRHRQLRVPSQQYGFWLVRQAISRNAMIVLLRSQRLWFHAVPELESHDRLCRLRSVQNTTFSPKNCPDGFSSAVDILSACSG